MIMLYIRIAIILAVTLAGKVCVSQIDLRQFKPIIDEGIKGKVYLTTSSGDTAWRKFLGFLPGSSGRTSLALVSEFKKVKAALTWHGHSSLYCVDPSGKLVAKILFTMPDELPFKMEGSRLYFRENANVFSVDYVINEHHLFCVRPTNCFEVVYR